MNQLFASDELAKSYLEIALENDKLIDFLVGRPLFALNVKDTNGNPAFSAMHVMEAIYEKHRENKNLMLDVQVYEKLYTELKKSKFAKDIFNITESIIYQINAEKQGKAAFSMDCISLLEALKDNLNRNKEFYNYSNEEYKIQSAWPKFENYDDRVYQSSGKRII